jgi:hypothetical protein
MVLGSFRARFGEEEDSRVSVGRVKSVTRVPEQESRAVLQWEAGRDGYQDDARTGLGHQTSAGRSCLLNQRDAASRSCSGEDDEMVAVVVCNGDRRRRDCSLAAAGASASQINRININEHWRSKLTNPTVGVVLRLMIVLDWRIDRRGLGIRGERGIYHRG